MTMVGRRGLTARKLARLDALLAEEGIGSVARSLPRRPAGEPAPLSVGEEQLWFLQRMAPEDPAYNMSFRLGLRGRLDAGALRAAAVALVARHEALRTAYPAVSGRPEKIEVPAPPPAVVDLRALPALAREEEAARLEREEAARPFDLQSGPVLRMLLLALGTCEHRLVLVVHHIAADGASVGILARELSALYGSLSHGLPVSLPEPGAQLGDFAAWQREWLRSDEATAQRSWWRERLHGSVPLDLPADRPAPAVTTSRGGFLPVAFDADLVRRLREVGQAERATLFMVALAALQALLGRYCDRQDVAVGSPVSGRTHPELETAVGFFVNMVVLRTDLGGDPTFRELIGRVRDEALEAFARGGFPFETLVEELSPERGGRRNPLFEVALVVEAPSAPLAGEPAEGDLTWELSDIPNGTAKFDLELELQERAEGLSGRIWYARDRFDPPTVARLAGHFRELLGGALSDPGQRLSALPLLTAAERQELLVDWADTARPYPADRGIQELFAERAAAHPERTALIFAGEPVSYGELARRAARIAAHLRALGVEAEDRVGLFAERSPELIAAHLGVLVAGAAYVPLDVRYPRERLEWMLEDAGLAAVLVQRGLVASLPASAPRPLVLEDIPPLPEREPGTAETWAGPDSAAYVMYTSGSTGRPKGVVVSHRNVVRLVRENDFARLDDSEVFLQLAPVAFDAATLEIWGPLLNGGTLVIADPRPLSLDELADVVEREGVTTLWLTAGLFHRMVDEQLARLGGVRQLLAGGDVLSPSHVERVLESLPGCRLINGYGPTENTTFTCCHTLRERPEGPVPIGRPITNTRVQVLDRELRPVPVGVPGELCAGGDGLARGYLGRPGLTAERFVPDPVSTVPGARLYRTGDLVRRRPDGILEFLGRLDHQVKIRGFRVEPGEVEARLGLHPGVESCAVVVRADRHGDKRLVAYVVAGEPAPAEAELRAFLERELPAPMIPAVFVGLDALPLGPNGKVDRRALPEPGEGPEEALAAAPRTPLEELTAGIWAEILGREKIGVHEDFFALGGHSLTLMQVASRLRSALGIDLPLRILFEAPTVAALAERLERERRSSAELPPLRRVPREGAPPLSFAQRRLWFLDQLEPGPAYNIPLALELRGLLDARALEAALGAVVTRHESLRTSFPAQGGEPVQAIAEPSEISLPCVDLESLPPTLRAAEAARLAALEARAPFDLARGPVLRALLLRQGAEEHELLLVLHHIASDGWSMRVLLGELEELYAAAREKRPALLAELPVQYADFALWQRAWLQGDELERQLAWWRPRLTGVPVLDLPADRPHPPVRTAEGDERSLRLPEELGAGLRALARREGVTLFMVLLASVRALLYRLSGQSDFAVGTPVANRQRPELEGLIGFFANTLVLRDQVSGRAPFRQLLATAREDVLGAHDHQDVPFETLVEDLQPERDLGRTPLFQVLLVLDNESAPPRLPGVATTARTLETGTAKLDLGFFFAERAEGTVAGVDFSAALFDGSTAERMLDHWLTLLAGAVADPGREVARLPVLGVSERQQLLFEWNDTRHTLGGEATIHGLFEAQAERTPGAEAIVWRDQTLTYAELDRRANQLAWRLRRAGVGPEARVAVLLRRTPELVVGLLGILKAGGCYVPLDPAYPARRLEMMLEDAGASVLLTESGLAATVPPVSCAVLRLDEEPASLEAESTTCPAVGGHTDNLGYLIYTSGSTGRPKAVAITHRSAVSLLRWARGVYGPETLTGVLAATSVCFDLSVFELFVPLAWGGRILLVDDALALASLPDPERVTLVNSVPSALTELVRLDALPSSVRVVNLAGEALHNSLVQAIYERGVERVYNLYGPSEDTTYSTFRLKTRGVARVPTIGWPLTGTRAYVLDVDGEPVPVGVPGELFLGGEGLARGYLGRPELTAEKFVPDPFAPEPGGRLYRTGDLVRRLPDGNLFFLGRIDHQVKVRGFRIELGEIEAALCAHPAVRQVAVAVQGSGDPALVAYAAPASEVPAPAELRRWLRERLPEHMVPSAFVRLEALPLSPNGKVDRKALPAPDPSGRSEAGVAPAVPRTPHEEIVAAVWAEVLGLEAVGGQDDFFALGGHSLKATQVVARLREALAVDLPVRAVFEAPTVAALATRVERGLRERQAGMEELPPLVPVPRDRRPPLSYAQQRLWFLDRLQPGNLAYSVPAYLDWDGPLRPDVLESALTALAARHEPLRTTFAVEEGEPVQVIAPRPSITLPQVDLTGLPSDLALQEAERRIAEGARLPFDLENGPLLRLTLLRLPGMDRLLTVFHHIVADWWSLGLFLRELGELYGAFAAGEADPLPALPVQYADYAVWQREWLRGERLEGQLAEWKRQLTDVPPLELPTDRPRPAVRTFRGASQELSLPASLGADLTALARREGGITRFMAVLAGFQLLLHRWTGQESFAVGTPIANRTHPGVEGLIGFFVNTLALRADLSGEPSFAELLRRVRETSLAAWAHQDVPFERLVEELAPRRELSQSPLFQVSLTFQNELPRWEGSGLDLAIEGVSLDTAKFDLTLGLGEGRDGLAGYLEVNADLFDGATAERLIDGFQRLLAAAVAAPDVPVGELPLLAEAERRQVLSEWNDTQGAAPALCVHERFAMHAAARPEAPALVCEEVRWTYGELHARASALARHLRTLGVGPEVRVGLCLERSAETVLSLLAVLQAGGAYVPLDPTYPRERLTRLLQESGAAAVITVAALRPRLPEMAAPVVCLDQLPLADGALSEPGQPGSGLDHLAYVLFTSGSTGTPKAVAIGHRQLAGYVEGVSARIGLPEGSSWATVSTFSADLGNTAVFPALCSGGCLHVISERRVTDPVLFAEYFRRERVDCLKIVPSHLAALRTGPDPAGVLPARRLVLGGEASSWEMIAGLRALAPGMGILNHYGPTETTVGVLTWEVGERVEPAATVPLGRPLPNVRVYVLDRRLEPLPPGVPGELCIGGDSLARGYLGRPDLTAERFVPDPHGAPGARLYRTGDRARFLAGGAVEFLGRIDHQVKIRGFRVEPGEIEAALERCAGVRAAVVLAREGTGGSRELAAWVAGDRSLSTAELREALRRELPPHMIPSTFVLLESLPLTPNGKVDRRALPAPEAMLPELSVVAAPELPVSGLAHRIAEVWREVLGVDRVGLRDNFFDLGGHSLLLIRVQGRLRQDLGLEVPVVDLFRFPTVAALAEHLGTGEAAPAPDRKESPASAPGGRCDIAVIGLSGRFPGARNVRELWENLCAGNEAITFFGEVEEGPGGRHVPARGVLADADLFDAGFFGIRPREAELLDPQHRLFLECAWEALESAGHDPARTSVPIGVWAGVGKGWYYLSQIHGGPGAGEPEAHFGNDKDFLPTRVSYKLGLRGPSLAVQTSCSSSLVAVHLACRSLAAGECGMALAGGVRIVVPQESGYVYEEGGIASPDGHCRAFDADARGVVPGNGVGVVLLRRLADALADGDPVLAVIRGSAINNDGFDKVGYTAPGVDGQARVIAAAQAAAGVTAGEIGYVEAHGTGTALGDPIEVTALKQAFGAAERGTCALGSIKTNLGHLDAAAGVTGLIKTVLALRHRQIPATLHFRRPNPELGLAESPFFVNSSLLPWESREPRRAGVSSFGIGGTNAHVVLEEAPVAEPSGSSRPWQLLTVSARSTAALARAADNLADHLESGHTEDLADVAWTLQVGRRAFPHRLAVVADGTAGAVEALRQTTPSAVLPEPSVAFLFPGQGAQRAGMARDLYLGEPVFRAEIDRAADLLRERYGLELREILDPPAGTEEEVGLRLEQTELTQPALFAVEHALARLWMSWGIRPAALLGHSVGEYVAACLAGVFSFEDALTLVAERGRLMGELPPGAMLAVPLAEVAVRARLGDGLSLAAVNGATACVVAGLAEAVETFRERLLAEGVEARRLRVSHAFHSAMMDPVLDCFAAAVARVERRPPSILWVSNVSGTWIRPEEAMDPAYWARHLREAVRFQDGLGTLLADPGRLLLEVGPGETLARFARRHPALAGRPVLGGSDQRGLLEALGGLWSAGAEPDWSAFHGGERRRRVALPTYPFERQRYWAQSQGAKSHTPASATDALAAARAAGGSAAVLLAVPAGAPPVAPPGWTLHPLEGPLSPELAAAFGQPLPTGGTFVLLRPAVVEPVPAAAEAGGSGAAPRDEIEAALAEIWREAFGIAHIGIHDGFFQLGGDSLLATQIVARARAAVGREIPLSAFLEAGTIARLAEACRSAPAAPAADVERLLADLESLSTEELEALLATQSSTTK